MTSDYRIMNFVCFILLKHMTYISYNIIMINSFIKWQI